MFESFRVNGALYLPRDIGRTEHDDLVLNVEESMFEYDTVTLTTVSVSNDDGQSWKDTPAWKIQSVFS